MTHNSAEAVRQLFLDFFKNHGHTFVKSSPLVPGSDPTLMFTNAGMVQFKDVFVGAETRRYKRATTVQKCMRVSGKHNDLEEVGRTARHHTFFEMLGNFSFGDYFKEQAIEYAWQFVTREVGLPQHRLWITVFGGADGLPADQEARTLWHKISGLPDSRILDKGAKDNFWAMGDVGPCGPCTEIHVDQGEGTPSAADFDNGRVMEIWNNVFMQFDRGTDGILMPLPAPSVDTGMGLERLVALAQEQDSNYHSDIFLPLLQQIAELAHKPYERSATEDDVSMRVVADHARATAFLAADGVHPSNEGRGYVMRRIMRRAVRHGRRLGLTDLFLHTVCAEVVQQMGSAYPELREAAPLIEKIAQTEEESFRRTLDTGLKILADEIDAVRDRQERVLPGQVVFKLYDTFGFPKDLTEVIAAEHALSVDDSGFDHAMEQQKERSRGGEVGQAAVADVYKRLAGKLGPTTFVGYPQEEAPVEERPEPWRLRQQGKVRYLEAQVTVVGLIQDGEEVVTAQHGDVQVILQPTPFYGESGGQVGDAGVLVGANMQAIVTDTQKPLTDLTVCHVRLNDGELCVGDRVWAGYDTAVRQQTRAHHSATHLLHGALRQVLGDHVKQAGSYVDAHHLRFDYVHFAAPTTAELARVEADANERIAADVLVETAELSFDAAKQKGAIALFGEKYGEQVRVITMGKSIEFCGGTHVARTGAMEMLLIVREEAVQSGVRRIEAEVGAAARHTTRQLCEHMGLVADLLTGTVPCQLSEDMPPPLLAVQKLVRTYHEGLQEIRTLGGEPAHFDAAAAGLTKPALPDVFGLQQATQMRNAWLSLTRLMNARPADTAVSKQTSAGGDAIEAAVVCLQQVCRDNERLSEQLRRSKQNDQAANLLHQLRTVGQVPLLCCEVEAADSGALRQMADALRSRVPSGVLALGYRQADKVALLIAVSHDLTPKLQAGALIKILAPLIGGRGGGKPELAQAGGAKPEGLPDAFARLQELVAPVQI